MQYRGWLYMIRKEVNMKNTQKYKILIDRIKRVVIKYKFELFGGFFDIFKGEELLIKFEILGVETGNFGFKSGNGEGVNTGVPIGALSNEFDGGRKVRFFNKLFFFYFYIR